MVGQTTGGYNAENNGIVKSAIKSVKRMIQAFLIGSAAPDVSWCVAFT